MVLSRKFSDKEILEIVAKYAVEALPQKLKGMVDAKFTKNGIEVFFIENQSDLSISSKAN